MPKEMKGELRCSILIYGTYCNRTYANAISTTSNNHNGILSVAYNILGAIKINKIKNTLQINHRR